MPMGVPGVAPRVVASRIVTVRMGAVVSSMHHDRCGSDDNGRWDAEADVDLDAGLSGLRLRKQYESQKWDHTIQAYDMGETFHTYILTVAHQLCSTTWRVIGDMFPPRCPFRKSCASMFWARQRVKL
jgi:hypothetical protein